LVKKVLRKNINYFLLFFIVSFVFSYYFWRVFYVSEPIIKLDIRAKWITSPFRSDQCYFKKSFFIRFPIKEAWIIFKSNGSSGYISLNNRIIFHINSFDYNIKFLDVSNMLFKSRNTLLLKIENKNVWENPNMILEIVYISSLDNSIHYIVSDKSWFVTFSNSIIENNEENYYKYTWLPAKELKRQTKLYNSYNIDIFTIPLNKFYFLNKDYLKINFFLNSKPYYAWIRISSNFNYQVFVNNQLVLSQTTRLPDLDTSLRQMTTFRIDRFLQKGKNEIFLSVRTNKSIKKFYLDGMVYTKNNKIYISPSCNLIKWTSNLSPRIHFKFIEYTMQEWSLFIILFCLIFLLLSLFFTVLIVKSKINRRIKNILATYLLISLFLMILFLSLNYDIRFVNGYFYKKKYFIFSLIAPIFILYFVLKKNFLKQISFLIKKNVNVMILIITFISFILRFKYSIIETLHPDESALYLKAMGMWKYFYPSIKLTKDLPVWYVTTSEFLSFWQAIFLKIFHFRELAIRLPSLISSSLAIPIIFLFSKILTKNIYVSFFSALFFAFLPSSIGMVSFGRYPSLLLLMALCSLYFLYLFFEENKYRFFIISIFCYLFTYFTWQGSIFFFPAILLNIFYLAKNFRIGIKLSFTYSIVLLFIGLHLLFRFSLVLGFPAILYGKSISGLTPTLAFFKPFFSPFYYLWNFFLVPFHQFLSLFFGFGILYLIISPKSKLNKRIIPIFITVFIPLFFMTCFLEIYNYRYSYYLLPYLIIGGLMSLWRICELYSRNKIIVFIILNVICFSISTDLIFKIRNFPYTNPQIKNYYDIYYYSRISKYFSILSPYMSDGDVVVALQPHLLKAYNFRHGLYIETRLVLPVVSNTQHFLPLHRIAGDKSLITIEDLKKIEASGRRVWIIMSPIIKNFFYPTDLAYIRKKYFLFYEDINTLVFRIPR